jgi:hypothetical protein
MTKPATLAACDPACASADHEKVTGGGELPLSPAFNPSA